MSILSLFLLLITPTTTLAVSDLATVTNNRFGVHIISATPEEVDEAATMINTSGGDWGYITVVLEDSDRDKDKWQKFFNELRLKHLIPIVRIATAPENSYWKLPYDQEEMAWADFLDSLNWPTKNRYVVIYNETNTAQEWGNRVDAAGYAQVLNKTINTLKNKNPDFFVLNGGFDASAPEKLPVYQDEEEYLHQMNDAVPGIFNKLDGWDSHSYPNPGYIGSPDGTGRGSVRTYQWELSVLQGLGLNKKLPVFITETGWKHSEGEVLDNSLPSSSTVGDYFKTAFAGAWSDPQIVAVTPFLLNYQNSPFDHFSFKKLESIITKLKSLATINKSPDPVDSYYPQYQTFISIPKTNGMPIQDNIGEIASGGIYSSLVTDQSYQIPITFKNTGESIWGEKGPISLTVLGKNDLDIHSAPSGLKVQPGENITLYVDLKAPDSGKFQASLALLNGSNIVNIPNLNFSTEVKSPVVLEVNSKLIWKDNPSGNYLLSILSSIGQTTKSIVLGSDGSSGQIQAQDILPDYAFDFTLKRQYYQPKTIHQTVHSGINTLNFGELQPDIGSALLNPPALWNLLPFSN